MKSFTKILTATAVVVATLAGALGTAYLLVEDLRDSVNNALWSPAPQDEPETAGRELTEELIIVDGDTNEDGYLSIVEKEAYDKAGYKLEDGTIVRKPKANEPVPAEILANIKTKLAPGMVDAAKDGVASIFVSETIKNEGFRINRTIVLVNETFDGDCYCPRWVAWTKNGPVIEPTSSKDAAVAAANAKAAKSDIYAVIVID